MGSRVYVRKAAEVLEAAERLFLSRGFAGTSMTDVAHAARVSKQTVYSNFENKQALFAAVIGRRSSVVLDVPGAAELAAADLRTALVELGAAFLRHIYSPGQIELFQTVVAESRQFPELGELMLSGPFVETPDVIAEVLRDRVGRGELEFARAEEAPAIFTSLLKADLHSRLLFSQSTDTSRERLRGIAERGVDIFLFGAIPGRRS